MGEAVRHDRPATSTRENAETYALEVVRSALEPLTTEDLTRFAKRVEETTLPTHCAVSEPELISAIMGREYSEQERIEMEHLALLQYFRLRRELLKESLTTAQVARLLGTSRQTPHDRVKSGTLLAVSDHGALRFPPWQFDPTEDDGVIAGLPEVVRSLHAPPLSKINWLVRQNPFLDGATPLATLKSGETRKVIQLARAAGRS